MLFLLKQYLPHYRKIIKECLACSDGWEATVGKAQSSTKKLNAGQLRTLGKILYYKSLKQYLLDLNLDQKELSELKRIEDYFGLKVREIKKIKSRLAKKVLTKLSGLKFVDNVFTEEEQEEMHKMAGLLEVPVDLVDSINRKNAVKIYKSAVKGVLEDRRLTEEEEKELSELKKSLGVEDNTNLVGEKDVKELAYCKLLYEVENGKLPETSSPVVTQKGEICHLYIDAVRLESKTENAGYKGSSNGVSLKLAKGVTYRVGNFRGGPIKHQVTYKYPGMLVITNKRIVFTGRQKGFAIPLDKLTNIEAFNDGMGFQEGSIYYLLQFKDVELIGLVISAAINHL